MALTLAACSVESKELKRLPSPDGSAIAILSSDTGGGAAGSSAINLYVVEDRDAGRPREPKFTASHCEELAIAWVDQRTLRLTYKPGCVIRKFENFWYSSSAIKNAQHAEVEIVLYRE